MQNIAPRPAYEIKGGDRIQEVDGRLADRYDVAGVAAREVFDAERCGYRSIRIRYYDELGQILSVVAAETDTVRTVTA